MSFTGFDYSQDELAELITAVEEYEAEIFEFEETASLLTEVLGAAEVAEVGGALTATGVGAIVGIPLLIGAATYGLYEWLKPNKRVEPAPPSVKVDKIKPQILPQVAHREPGVAASPTAFVPTAAQGVAWVNPMVPFTLRRPRLSGRRRQASRRR
jgi:hypothetical protein